MALRDSRHLSRPVDRTRCAARGFASILHYTIEERARQGTAYGADNPYRADRIAEGFDPERFPLAATAVVGFEHGLHLLLTGMAQSRPRCDIPVRNGAFTPMRAATP